MSDEGVKLFARVIQAQARIEGMKATNFMRERNGNQIAYGEDAFEAIVFELDGLIVSAINSPGFGRS